MSSSSEGWVDAVSYSYKKKAKHLVFGYPGRIFVNFNDSSILIVRDWTNSTALTGSQPHDPLSVTNQQNQLKRRCATVCPMDPSLWGKAMSRKTSSHKNIDDQVGM